MLDEGTDGGSARLTENDVDLDPFSYRQPLRLLPGDTQAGSDRRHQVNPGIPDNIAPVQVLLRIAADLIFGCGMAP